jgi:hypothetical protein
MGYMAKALFKRGQRVFFHGRGKNATVVAVDTGRSLKTVFYIITVDGESKDRFNVTQLELSDPR